jgi:endonuclease YncB( thermonuclease family)
VAGARRRDRGWRYGDCLEANGRKTIVRLEGIDCPESGQPFGGVARRFIRVAVFDQFVVVRPITHDVHGRLVARIEHEGKDLSLELISKGLAWHYTEYSRDPLLASAEQAARRSKRGIWSDPVVFQKSADILQARRDISCAS